MITLGILNDVANVRHAFFTREGGVSTGLYTSLNCSFGSGDDPANVARNRAIAMTAIDLPPEALVAGYQVHSADVVVVDKPWGREHAPKVDGLVTKRPGIALGVLTADCVPVLLADRKAGIVAAAHAGWRGAKAGIIAAVVEKMCALGATRESIAAGLGPAIAQRSYEVGPEFPELILGRPLEPGEMSPEQGGESEFFAPANRPGHFMFDLAGYVMRRCLDAGIKSCDRIPSDTLREEGRFYSYRRSVLRGEPDYGRCLSAIALES
ncbi:MAG TPA: peptidoglycan editing factor PgeF [Alphaproteobacteria bacterium]|nr:peptidoglycan editing factor PgeF [Alphaproteobacteria bacterium]